MAGSPLELDIPKQLSVTEPLPSLDDLPHLFLEAEGESERKMWQDVARFATA